MIDLAAGNWNLAWEFTAVATVDKVILPLTSPVFTSGNLILFTRNPNQPTWKFTGNCFQKADFQGQDLTIAVKKIYFGYQLLTLLEIVGGFSLFFDFASWHQLIEIKVWEQIQNA